MIYILTVCSIVLVVMGNPAHANFAGDGPTGPAPQQQQQTAPPPRPAQQQPAPQQQQQAPRPAQQQNQAPIAANPPPLSQQQQQQAAPPADINFPKCGIHQPTGNAALAKDMIKHVLNIDNPYRRRLLGPGTPSTWDTSQRLENSFTLFEGRGRELQVRAVKDGQSYDLPGYLCQNSDGSLDATLVYTGFGTQTFVIKIRPISSIRVSISPVENGREVFTKSAQFQFDDVRGTR